jgi:N-glycosylase/DNA lyase
MSQQFVVEIAPDELDLGLCVSSGQVFRWRQEDPGVWFGVEGEHWYRVETHSGGYRVESNGCQEDFSRLFRLDWSSREVVAELTAKGPEIKPYIDAMPGLRTMRPSNSVETFFCFLCTPNNNVARITTLVRQLAAYGPIFDEVGGQAVHCFPGVERIAAIPESELRAKAFGYRGATIPGIAGDLLSRGGVDYLNELKTGSYEEAHARLLEFKGIGPKLADCIALFALDHSEAVPIDTHIWQAAVRLYFPEWQTSSLTGPRYKIIGDFFRTRFGRYAGWAHQYLFYENLLNWRTRLS